ncbi:MAG: tetratricopeptide repeat protein [Acidobacteriaceae bacterium]|nr:tetratricopeptide repeat protein [Acidobacteriaceae bacterium]
MLGSFAALGERLLVNVQLYESAHGRLLVSDQFVVNRTTDVLGQVDLMSLKLTARLGAAPSDRSRNVSLAEVMTNNFEAYRYYSLGLGKAQNFENAEAVTLLRKAIELDPKFAMAYARIGYAYSVTDFLPDQGTPYLERAFRLSDRLTEKDRLYVSAWYAIARRDYLSAIRTLQQLIAQYPLEMEAYARLARLLDREERVEAAISVIQQGLAVDPDAADLYNALGICFLGLHRYQDAIAAHERYVQLSPMEPNAHDSLGMSYQQAGRYADAAAEYKAALALNSKFEPAIIHLGDVYCQEGRYRDGIREYQRYSRVTQSGAARAVAFGSIAQVYRWKGDVRLGEQAARTETSYQPGAVWNSLLFALDRGDKAEASRLRERLFEDSPYPERGVRHELRSYDYYLGAIALKNGQSEEALSYFKEALRHLPPSSGLDLYEDCLANAYLELGRLDDAISEYERILHLNPNYPLAQYHLGQAYERKGQFQQARSAYLAFLNVWPDADSDIPEVIEAKEAAYATSARIR